MGRGEGVSECWRAGGREEGKSGREGRGEVWWERGRGGSRQGGRVPRKGGKDEKKGGKEGWRKGRRDIKREEGIG